MNLDRYFSVPLFREGLRRLALPAAGLGIAVLLVNLPLLVSQFPHGWRDVGYDDYPYGWQLCPVIFAYMIAAPLLLGMWQFRFLNRQDGVDFFMAAPATRAALFNAFSLAGLVLQWLTVIVVVVAGALLFHGYGVRLHAGDVLWAIFTGCIGAFLGWAITACAVAVCNGPIATAALAAIMFFVPTFLQIIVLACLSDASFHAFVDPGVLSLDANLYFDALKGALGNCYEVGGAGALASALALAAGYYLLGVYAFARRQAEGVGRPGVVYQALAAAALFLTLLVPLLLMADACVSVDWDAGVASWKAPRGDWVWVCVAVILGFYALAYALFRRWRPLLFSTLLVPLAVGVAALATAGGWAWGERFRAIVPAADEVVAVTFLPSPFCVPGKTDDFAGLRTADPRVCRRAAASLAKAFKRTGWENAEDVESDGSYYAVRLELRDGTCLSRAISFYRRGKEPPLRELLMADPANAVYWRLPGAGQVCGFGLTTSEMNFSLPQRHSRDSRGSYEYRGDAPHWEVFRQEYAAAIASAPALVARRQQKCHLPLFVVKFRDRHGRMVTRWFPIITRLMPQTREWLREARSCPLPILSEDGEAANAARAENRGDNLRNFTCADLDSPDEEDGYGSSWLKPSRFAAVKRFLAPIQARVVAPGESAKYHLVHCKLHAAPRLPAGLHGVTQEYHWTVKNYLLLMTPEEIAKLRELLGRE